MDFPNFVGPSYQLRNFSYDKQRCVNWLTEIDESGGGKDSKVAQFVPRPGLRKILTGYGQARGLYEASSGVLYGVFGNQLYQFNTSSFDPSKWTSSVIRSIAGVPVYIDGTDPVQFVDNGLSLFIVGGELPYVYDWRVGFFSPLTDGAYSKAITPVYLDARVIFLEPDTQRLYWTDANDYLADGANFAFAQSDPEIATGLIVYNQEIWVFGRRTIEVWYDTGEQDQPFNRRGNTILNVGCDAPSSIVRVASTLGWLGSDTRGGPMVMFANGYTPQRVSTFALEEKWARIKPEDLANATAQSLQLDGHDLYVLTIPGEGTTWVYDVTASAQMQKPMWTEWQSDPGTGIQGRFLGANHVYHHGNHIFTHFGRADIFAFDKNYYKDDERFIMRERVTPYIANEMKRVFYKSLTLNFATGDR